jgi:hypothetical protein
MVASRRADLGLSMLAISNGRLDVVVSGNDEFQTSVSNTRGFSHHVMIILLVDYIADPAVKVTGLRMKKAETIVINGLI